MLKDKAFPTQVLNKPVLWLMHRAWSLGLANYDYALRAALVYAKYGGQAKGQFEGGRS